MVHTNNTTKYCANYADTHCIQHLWIDFEEKNSRFFCDQHANIIIIFGLAKPSLNHQIHTFQMSNFVKQFSQFIDFFFFRCRNCNQTEEKPLVHFFFGSTLVLCVYYDCDLVSVFICENVPWILGAHFYSH